MLLEDTLTRTTNTAAEHNERSPKNGIGGINFQALKALKTVSPSLFKAFPSVLHIFSPVGLQGERTCVSEPAGFCCACSGCVSVSRSWVREDIRSLLWSLAADSADKPKKL
ncbi:hypothetical protein DPEC_G00033080 [Dallia pectoralis]|uniref:Uncharacterized protein n=1 Tax=Dallia pectoralis TaxID=75939 RepID=A0ACC2HCP6_DALPE|nr:hypothetical protein DPEC_G00033080 [Dallia pectoralis]